jgi:hypothetical protein
MSLSGSMDSTGFRAKARGLAAAVNHGLKAVVNTLRYCRLFDFGRLNLGSMNWKRYFQPDIFKLFDNRQIYRSTINWKFWFLCSLVRIEIYSDSMSSGKGSDLTTAFKPWLISMRC